jgi:hypothetical protein
MMNSPKRIKEQFLEIIALMSKRFIHTDWPNLVPVSMICGYLWKELLANIKNAQDFETIKYALECFKKIAKKYRYMFRSDALYMEMNYMIENLSPMLLAKANVSFLKVNLKDCVEGIKANIGNLDFVRAQFNILNSIFHIIESFLA